MTNCNCPPAQTRDQRQSRASSRGRHRAVWSYSSEAHRSTSLEPKFLLELVGSWELDHARIGSRSDWLNWTMTMMMMGEGFGWWKYDPNVIVVVVLVVVVVRFLIMSISISGAKWQSVTRRMACARASTSRKIRQHSKKRFWRDLMAGFSIGLEWLRFSWVWWRFGLSARLIDEGFYRALEWARLITEKNWLLV